MLTAVHNESGVDYKVLQNLLKEKNYLTGTDVDDERIARAVRQEVVNFARECRLTSEYYLSNKRDANLTHIVLAGIGSTIPGITEYLHQEVELEVVVHDILKTVDFNLKFDRDKVKAVAPILSIAVGAALAGGELDD